MKGIQNQESWRRDWYTQKEYNEMRKRVKKLKEIENQEDYNGVLIEWK